MVVKTKRIYDDVNNEDGIRILVDRIWPRGVSKEKAKLDCWLKNIAPLNELRKYFGHKKDKFNVCKEGYKQELNSEEALESYNILKEVIFSTNKNVTLLYAAKDETYNNAQILMEMVTEEQVFQ